MISGLKWLVFAASILATPFAYAQEEAGVLVKKLGAKIDQVNNYVAEGRMKTNVSFLKVPESPVKIYFKKPNRIKIRNEK